MKNASFIFTKSRMGLDNGVWLTMLLILIISSFILGFKAITKENCSLDPIIAGSIKQQSNNIFSAGEPITFSIPAKPGDKIEWNFDDGTALQKGGKVMQHSFLKQGGFNVTCIVNGKCKQSVLINIISAPLRSNDSEQPVGNPIIGMDTVIAGTTGHFSTLIKANYNYQWSSSAAPDIQTTQGADFTFYKEGPQNITLKIDGTKSYTKPIFVSPKKSLNASNADGGNLPVKPLAIPPAITSVTPVSGGPGTTVTILGSWFTGTKSVSFGGVEAKFVLVSSTEITAIVSEGSQSGPVAVVTDVAPTTFANPPFTYIAPKAVPAVVPPPVITHKTNISDKQLKVLLELVVDNKKHVQDFDEYFCSGANTKVYVNNEKKPISFTELCQRLVSNKKNKIESASISRDPENTECVTNINVNYKKPGFLHL